MQDPVGLPSVCGQVVIKGQLPDHTGYSQQTDTGPLPEIWSLEGGENNFSADVLLRASALCGTGFMVVHKVCSMNQRYNLTCLAQ